MTVARLTENEVYDYLDQPFNPPKADTDEAGALFSTEWHQVRDDLMNVLSAFGENDPYATKDFYLGDTLSLSRGIGVEITSQKMLNSELVPHLQKLLASIEPMYEVDLAISLGGKVHHVFVNRDGVKAWCPKATLKAFDLKD